ncbi:MAG: hypothetical protein DUD27_04430 [Lachnospiraceae bacterium]|nr:MAG: hypothetical protein DUD27_04430 [Lachnospiraceae bacterium]
MYKFRTGRNYTENVDKQIYVQAKKGSVADRDGLATLGFFVVSVRDVAARVTTRQNHNHYKAIHWSEGGT